MVDALQNTQTLLLELLKFVDEVGIEAWDTQKGCGDMESRKSLLGCWLLVDVSLEEISLIKRQLGRLIERLLINEP